MGTKHGNRFLIVGANAREAALARRLATDSVVYALGPHPNPTILDYVSQTGGKFLKADGAKHATLVRFAQKEKIDYVVINTEATLAQGGSDALLAQNIPTIGGTRAATRIEWDKSFALQLVHELLPALSPVYKIARTANEVTRYITAFAAAQCPVVVKPPGLTGGKGVKVMPVHLSTYAAAQAYAQEICRTAGQVILVEKTMGKEFTLTGFCDGMTMQFAPPTYDYPYRYPNDQGPGTGGMGCWTTAGGNLPFLSASELALCHAALRVITEKLRQQKTPLQGVLTGGFFKTDTGIKFMEFNCRWGDPEAINILELLEGSWADVIRSLWHGNLAQQTLQWTPHASVVKYLVAPEYPRPSPQACEFSLAGAEIENSGVGVHWGCAVKNGQGYKTLKRSRICAFSAVRPTIAEAARAINTIYQQHLPQELDLREDIGLEAEGHP